MRTLSVITLLAALVLPAVAFAEVQTFTTTHTYALGDDHSRNSARQKCLAEAKRKILEQVGVYLESKSELITSSQSRTSGSPKSPQTTNEERQQITEQIDTLSAGVLRTEVIKEEFGEINGRLQITLSLKAEVDSDDIQRQLAARRVDQGVRKQVTEQQQRLAQLEEKLSSMMKEMRSSVAPEPQKKDGGTPDMAAILERANRGDAEAQTYLGFLYDNGRGVPQDYARAQQWWEQAAAQGNAWAQFNLGVLYDNGRGVPQDYAKARQWYEQAAARGNAWAQTGLGFLYAKGQGVPQDYAKARQWWEQAEAQGNAWAQNGLGAMYDNGLDVAQDYAKARQWYEKAAAQGNAGAQTNLGFLYDNGRGVPQDYGKARQWYEQAAAQGDSNAQLNLGLLHDNGRGVSRDYAKARGWFEQAAAQGNAGAQNNLGLLYANGQGVPQDDVTAYMWWYLVTAGPISGSQKIAADNRDKVARRMTPAQIAEAQRLAQQCQTRRFKDC